MEKNIYLFESPTNSNLCQCVSSDLRIIAGVTKDFREKFSKVSQLKEQNPEQYKILFLKVNTRFI